ncbi:hypothetical protein BCR35DRAFT_301817 [Leucosporidium creatinivorum]|uniref:Uncharacterized protein n=1 Tax=Leucosporidium creatinivorum TaxID=106004 RepID=A0A1Y2G090_9BASI|nr:hypothetical protein BCR35DRAFT_301817 [Leucosporidium creatinivorum]
MASPATASLSPFLQPSPPRRRAHPPPTHRVLGAAQLPTSSSEGALAVSPSNPLVPPPPGQSSKIKPFILRSTSPANARARAQSPPAGPGLSRAASVPAFNSKPKPAAGAAIPPLPTKSTKSRRSDRPTFVPGDPSSSSKPSGRANNKPSRWSTAEDPQRPRRSSIILAPQTKLQAVEQRKIEMKRASVLARRHAEGGGTPSSVEKGKRWLASLAGGGSAEKEGKSAAATLQQARRKASLGDMTNGRRSAPSPPAIESSSPSDDLYSSSASSATIMPHGHSLRAPRSPTKRRSVNDLTTPPRQTSASPLRAPGGSTERLRKDRYAALSRSKSAERPATTARGEEAYSSMQEMLEHSGFADVRVITPTSTLRVAPPTSAAIPIPGLTLPAPQPQPHPLAEHSSSLSSSLAFSDSNAYGSPSSLAPPLSLAHKTSMLSLRGLFSLWKADAAAVGDVAAAPQGDGTEQNDEEGSEAGSDDTITLERKRRFVAHTQQWVDQVSREVATLSASPATLLHQSSSPSLAAYPPRQATPRKSSAPSPAAVTEQSALRESSDRRRSKQALKTLRHVVSDSDLASSVNDTPERPSISASGYQSFALGGLALGGLSFPGAGGEEESRKEYDDVSSASEDEGSPHHQRRHHRQASRPPPPPNFDPNSLAPPPPSFWGSLRTRASEALLGSSPTASQPQAPQELDDSVRRPRPLVIVKKKSAALRPVLSTSFACGTGAGMGSRASRED